MLISIIRTDSDLMDVVIHKSTLGALYVRIDQSDFLYEIYRIIVQFPQDYIVYIHDYIGKKSTKLNLFKKDIDKLNKKNINFNKGLEILKEL